MKNFEEYKRTCVVSCSVLDNSELLVQPSHKILALPIKLAGLLLAPVEDMEAPDAVANVFVIHPTRNFSVLRCNPDVFMEGLTIAERTQLCG
jgi:hypothetical protein